MTESYGTITITDTTDITKIENWYLASNKSSGVTVSESGWTTDVTNTNAVMTANKQYLWNYEKILGTGEVVINTTAPVIIGRYGQNGGTGAAGKGISSIDEYYQVTNSTTNPGSSGWQKNTLVVPTASNPYLWNYQVINYVNPTSTEGTYADARIIGVYGDKGDTGTSVLSTIKYYQLATSKPSQPSNNAAIPSGWGTDEPTFDSSKTLYTVIQTTYSNGNIVYSAVQVDSAFEAAKVAYQKAQDAQTDAGAALTSANGKNTIYYQASKPTGGTYKAGDTWFDTDDGNAIYTWNNTLSDWVSAQLGQNAIADLAITNAKIANGTIQDAKIGNLDAGKITTGSLDADRIKASVISAVNSSTETSDGSSLKISANKVNIDGTAIFTNEDFQTALNNQGYQTANDVSEAISNISIDGRNLIHNTLIPDVTSNNTILNIGGDSTNGYAYGASTGEITTAIHGLRHTVTSASRPGICFGPNNVNIGLHGLETGKTYTWSFDWTAKIFSGSPPTGTNYYLRATLGYVPADSNSYNTSTYKDIHIYRTSDTSDRGAEISGSGEFTFELPVGATAMRLYITTNSTTASYYQANDFLELRNIKLEAGNKSTDWTFAPEDTDTAINKVQINLNTARSWYAECPTAAATAAKVATIKPVTTDFTLTTGTTVAVKFTSTNTVANPTLNVNETGAIAIKRYGDTAPSTSAKTSWQANSINTLTYDGAYWRLNNWLNDDTTYNLGRNLHATAIKVLEAVPSGWLMAGTASGYKKIAAGLQFSLSYPLLYASAAYTANTTYTNTYETWNSVTYTTTAAVQSGAANKTIYLKGTVSANTFTIDSANVFTTVEPTSADGCFYIPLGIISSATSSTTVGNFSPSNSLYAFIDGRFRQVTPTEIVVSQRIYYRSLVAGTVSKPTVWIEQTGNKYNDTVSVGNSGWSTKVTPIAKSTAETTTTNKKYLFLYTCEQRKRLDGTVDCTPVLLDDSTTVIDGGNIITGTVTANQIQSGSLSIGVFGAETQNDILNSNIEIGGRNLLRNTKDYAEATYTSTCTFAKDSEGITVITFPAYTGSVGWKGVTLHPNIPYTLIKDKTVTLSFWYRSDSWTLASGGHNYPLPSFEILETATSNPSGTNRLKYVTIYDATVPAPTTEWQQFVRTYNITDNFFTAGSGTVTENRYFTIQMFQHNLSHLQYKKIQLEIGNKVTDWTPASEDVDANIEEASKNATNYIVADSNGIKIANANPSTASTYLQLASSFLEFVRGGASMLKLWLDNSVAKIRVGAETGFNTLTDNEGIKIRNGTTVLSQFGTSLIELGKNSVAAIISLCGNKATLHYDELSNSFQITSKKMYLISRDVESEADDTSELIALTQSEGLLVDASAADIHGVSFAKLVAGDASTGSYSSIGAYAQGSDIHINSSQITLTNSFYESESFSMTEAINAIPVMLYNNDSASLSGARTLSETAANFRKLTICFKSNNGSYGSVDVWNPNGKNVCLAITDMTDANPHIAYHKVKTVKINGTSIDTAKGDTYKTMQLQLGGTYTSTQVDNIGITQVIGYR